MNNTLIKSLIGGAVLTGTAMAGEVCTQKSHCTKDAGFDTALKVGYDSQYLFRGVNRGDDLLSTSLETSFQCALTGLDVTAGAWYGSYDNTAGVQEDELDLYLGVSKELGFARANTGFIHREILDNGGSYAQEVYFGLSKDLSCGLQTSLTYFWDVNGGDAANDGDNNGYTELTLAKSFDVLSNKLDLGVKTGYLVEESEFSHITATLSHDIALSENATLSPYIAHSWELEGQNSSDSTSSRAGQENELVAGAALKVSF